MQVTEEKSQGKNIWNREELEKISEKVQISEQLRQLGMPSHLLGYQYAREAIGLCLESPDKIYKITKELYPEIAKKYKSTSSRVERAIRNAIEVAWGRGDQEYIKEIFGNTVSIRKRKPTNSEFIAQIAEVIRINNQKESNN